MHFSKTAMPVILCGALGVVSMPAFADVTGPELWLEWQAAAKSDELDLSVSSQSYADGVLTLTGLTLVIDTPENPTTVLVPEVVFADQSDGTVKVNFPADMTMEMSFDGDAVVRFSIAQDGLDWVASGDEDQRKYNYHADETSFSLVEALVDGEVMPANAKVVATDMTYEYLVTDQGSDMSQVVSEGSLADLDISFEGGAPGEPSISVSYQLRDIKSQTEGPLFAMMDTSDPSAVFTADQPTIGELSHGGGGYVVLVDDPSEPLEISGSSSAGGYEIAIQDGALDYDLHSSDVKFLARTSALPFPVEVSADQVGLSALIPMVAQKTASDLDLGITLAGLTISKGIWNMFDETAVLPRDPATLILQLSGKAQLFTNLFDVDQDTSEVPGDLKALTLDKLQITAAGAELNGSGDFTVDTSATGAIPDAPKLVGVADFGMSGANGLIDNLIKIGLIQPEDALGVRMMMGLFARPGSEADSLVSKVELTETGGLVVNGMQLQ